MAEKNMLFATETQQTDLSQDGVPEVLVEKYLVFCSDGLMFGVNAEYVVEIIINHTITQLPLVPAFVSGIINLRGQIIPTLDIRLLMGKMHQPDCSIIVLNIDGTQLGIQVDSVAQMVNLPEGSVLPVPAHNAQKFVSGMCSLPDGSGTMMILDCQLLLPE